MINLITSLKEKKDANEIAYHPVNIFFIDYNHNSAGRSG